MSRPATETAPMAATAPESVSIPVPASTAVKSLTRVHKVDSVSEQLFWSGHVVFTVLALVGVLLILVARGPRRKEANASALLENRESGSQPSGTQMP
jgi:hypothetical protein